MPSSFRDLRVWQDAMKLACEVYTATAAFPKHEVYGLMQQMRRAAVSVPSNIAEGKGASLEPRVYAFSLPRSRIAARVAHAAFDRARITILAEGLCGASIRVGQRGGPSPEWAHKLPRQRSGKADDQRPRTDDKRSCLNDLTKSKLAMRN